MSLLAQQHVRIEDAQFYVLLIMQLVILACMFIGFRRIGRNQQQLAELLRQHHAQTED